MPGTAVVTDSTAYLSPQAVADAGIRVVPVEVIVAGKPRREGVDIDAAQVAEALRSWQTITTSRPSPADFTAAYEQAADAGATSAVSIHLSGSMSGTYESALLASRAAPLPVTVLDSRTVAMGLGFGVLAAAAQARTGADAEAVTSAARSVLDGAHVLFYVDTLEYLRRGGRIGAGAALVGTALRVKPLLQVKDGAVVPLEKARTAGRALARLADLAAEAAGTVPCDVAVQHLDSADRAEDLAARLRDLMGCEVSVGEIGAVVGAHVGPGTVAVSIAPKP